MTVKDPGTPDGGPGRLVGELAGHIKQRILNGTYGPGERLRQEAVAGEFGVSRTPLREALRMLEREGLVILRPGRGAEVVSGDVGTLLQAYRVREVLDGLAARNLALRHTGETLGTLQAIIDRQRLTLDPWQPEEYAPLNVEFHGTIFQAADNEYLARQTSVLHMTANVFVPYRLLDAGRVRKAITEHQRILDSIRTGQADAAEAAARDHIAVTIRTLENDRRRPA